MITRPLFILILGLLALPELAAASRLDVCPRGCAYTNLPAAVAAARAFDTIYVHPGVYRVAHLQVDKPLAILGLGSPELVSANGEEIITVTAPYVTISGLHLQGVHTSYLKEYAAIRVKRTRHFSITHNRFTNTFFGVYLEHAHQGVVSHNRIAGQATDEASSGNGVHAWYSDSLLISHNHFSGQRDGIYLEFVSHSHINDNYSHHNLRYGLHFMFSNHNSYTCNTFEDNGAGVAVMFSKFISMTDNCFFHNWGRSSYGLLLKEIYDADIRHNRFVQNTVAITAEGSTRIIYQHNAFLRNGWGLKISGGCLDNVVTHNDFMGNMLDLVVDGRVNNNTFNQNYWSEHTGYDLNHDGLGDTPYRPVKLFAYLLARSPESIVLMRSFFVDLLNFTEKISPAFTPENVLDHSPLMYQAL